MKQVFTLSFLLLGLSVFSQQKNPPAKQPAAATTVTTPPAPQETPVNPRATSTSSQVKSSEVAPLPYDVNDKYMGRKSEFLNSMTVSELPADFPAYEKQWNLKEYNQVVEAYFVNHRELLKPRVKEKIDLAHPTN
ncbi:MAG: hypothetical protein JWO09_2361 [Bacteroidetes bacterium]|nr:hypothetical protein [Bacteroidota bacterium]